MSIRSCFVLIGFLLAPLLLSAQSQQQGQMFRLGEGVIRVAEPGQLADSLHIWGDIANGRYVVPRNSALSDIISYARGVSNVSSGETILEWTHIRMEVYISRYDQNTEVDSLHYFEFIYGEPLPPGFRTFKLQNNDMVLIQMRRKRTWVDYIRRYAGAISTAAGLIFLYERFL